MPSNKPRSLDRLLRTLRGTIRTNDLARPDRLVISTQSGSIHLDLSAGPPRDRVAGLLDWADALDSTQVLWSHHRNGAISFTATGFTAGSYVGVTATVTVSELGGHLVNLDGHTLAIVPGLGSLTEFEWHASTSTQLRQALTATDSRPSAPVASLVPEVAA